MKRSAEMIIWHAFVLLIAELNYKYKWQILFGRIRVGVVMIRTDENESSK